MFRPPGPGQDITGDETPNVFVPDLSGLRFDTPAPRLDWGHLAFDAPIQAPAPVAFEYSDAYRTRNRIDHIASFATLPLFAAEAYIGQRMFNNPADATAALRHAHGTIAIAISGLFGVNSVTGVWNMVEARKDPHGLMRRTIHGALMLVADAGFFATALDHPNDRTASGIAVYDDKKNQHLALAYASLSVATVSYVMMLFR